MRRATNGRRISPRVLGASSLWLRENITAKQMDDHVYIRREESCNIVRISALLLQWSEVIESGWRNVATLAVLYGYNDTAGMFEGGAVCLAASVLVASPRSPIGGAISCRQEYAPRGSDTEKTTLLHFFVWSGRVRR